VCDDCIARFAVPRSRCSRCALVVPEGIAICGACLADPPPYALALAAVDYAHPWDSLITQFKFHGGLDLAPALVARLLAARHCTGLPSPVWVLPVPLSATRLRERGYNQAWEIARRLARRLGCATDAHLLLRIHDRPHQLALPPDRRVANVRGAFAVEPRRLAELRGREVVIVDDVMTTGATAAEITRVLLHAGALAVQCWVVARTPRPGES
jgi:ComF family protein